MSDRHEEPSAVIRGDVPQALRVAAILRNVWDIEQDGEGETPTLVEIGACPPDGDPRREAWEIEDWRWEVHVGCGDYCPVMASVPYDFDSDGPHRQIAEAIAQAGEVIIGLVERVQRTEAENAALRARLAEVDGVFAASDAERCDLGCPHGDRCRLKAGHDGNHNMGVCPCNEPMAPVLPGAVEVDPTEALERVLGVTRRSAGATGTVIDGPEGPLVRCTGLGRWWVVSNEGVEFGGADETFADACLACLRLIAAGKITHSGPGLDALTPGERAALERMLGEAP